ncbi:ATP-dependent RecD-like DNA helicase [Cytobacillus kochii]|uniref:AAA family ATPase n=1 Tax=Cytobacillus kochii TaxID=859143 RepID=UPI001CD1C306|nr:AAA family ATPase [Cytobacillus kochii]MCA1025702.1 ATP-dependent RecD-like DNA helicase [Cytobacillus kochii]
MTGLINVTAQVSRELFYNQEDMYGVFAFRLIKGSEFINIDRNNFVVSGNCHSLVEGKEYNFTIKPSWSKKYGDGYEFVEFEKQKLNTVEDQREYLRQILPPSEVNSLIAAYPNEKLVDLIKEGNIDINLLNGIKEAKLEKITSRVLMYENLQLALIELKGLGITMTALQRLVSHFGSEALLIDKIKENIYVLTEVDLFGFLKVDEYAMKRGDSLVSSYRIKACFEHILKEVEKDGHSWIELEDAIRRAEELLKIDTELIVDFINKLKDKPGKFHLDLNRFALKKNFYYENEIKKKLDILLKSYQPSKDLINIELIEKENKITYTEEQRDAINLANNSGVFILNGKAGTGKTTVLKGVIDAMRGFNYATCALSGKAAKVLESKGIRSMTIHRLLKIGKDGRFVYNEDNPLPYQTIIIDESSMVNSYLFYSLVMAIRKGSRLIIVGDNGQLPAIGVGAIFDDLVSTKFYPNKELTQVHRQAQKSGILTTANEIREGNKISHRYDTGTKVFGELEDMVLIPVDDREDIFSHILSIAEDYYEKYGEATFNDFQILTALKTRGVNSVKNLNIQLQGIFNDQKKDYIEKNGYQFREGDKVIQNGNFYKAMYFSDLDSYLSNNSYSPEDESLFMSMGFEFDDDEPKIETCDVFNGTMGIIRYINWDKKEVLIQFEDSEDLVLYDQQDLKMVELGYAITIHKSQGIGVKNVLATFDYVAFKMLSRQLLYTAWTRASQKLVVICENGALHKGIEVDHGSTRNTFLKYIILEEAN